MTPPKIEAEPPEGLKPWLIRELGSGTRLAPLAGGGGARRYFRLTGRGLLALYGPERRENMAWLGIGRLLWSKGLPLPRIRRWDMERGFFLLDDLGDGLLSQAADRLARLPRAVANLARLHREGSAGCGWAFQARAFDAAAVFRLEIKYFIEYFLIGYLGLSSPRLPGGALLGEAREFSRLALPEPADRVLMHRDYQGRNLIVRGGEVFILDWQGARPGPAAYDLASLLDDSPHEDLAPRAREGLIRLYLKKSGRQGRAFRRELEWLAVSRLMQSLGAFGRLTLAGKAGFGPLMAPALRRLAERLGRPAFRRFPALREAAAAASAALAARARGVPGGAREAC